MMEPTANHSDLCMDYYYELSRKVIFTDALFDIVTKRFEKNLKKIKKVQSMTTQLQMDLCLQAGGAVEETILFAQGLIRNLELPFVSPSTDTIREGLQHLNKASAAYKAFCVSTSELDLSDTLPLAREMSQGVRCLHEARTETKPVLEQLFVYLKENIIVEEAA